MSQSGVWAAVPGFHKRHVPLPKLYRRTSGCKPLPNFRNIQYITHVRSNRLHTLYTRFVIDLRRRIWTRIDSHFCPRELWRMNSRPSIILERPNWSIICPVIIHSRLWCATNVVRILVPQNLNAIARLSLELLIARMSYCLNNCPPPSRWASILLAHGSYCSQFRATFTFVQRSLSIDHLPVR
jgi:hypothetical protein